MRRILLFLLLISASTVSSQIGTLDWRIHFSSFNTVGIAETSSEIYMACSNGIVEYDLEDNSVNMLTVTNGLSDLGISEIDSDGNTVMVGYSNGNLDIIEGNTITNVPWIKIAEIGGNKQVNSFYFDGDTIYVATNIGLVVIDNRNKDILDTYYPFDDPSINDVTIFQDTLFCATTQGIYYAHKNTGFLNDKNQWTQKTDLPFSIVNDTISEIETFGNRLVFVYSDYVFQSDSMYFIENGILSPYSGNPVGIYDLREDDDKLIFGTFGSAEALDQNLTQTDLIFSIEESFPIARGALIKNGEFWIADDNHGMVRAINSWDNSSVFSNSPYADGSYRMDIQYGTLLVAGGGLTHNLQPNYFQNGVYKFEDETWTNFNAQSQDSINPLKAWDFISVVVNPNDQNDLAFGSRSESGIMVIKDGGTVTEVYNTSNSPLETFGGYYIIPDMKYDSDGNLWVINQGVEPLKCLTPEGIWYSFTMGSAAKEVHPYRLTIDRNGTKWVGFNQVGLVAFNDGGTLDDPNDDQWKTLSAAEGYGNLPTLFPKAVTEDIDGELWIGTDLGLVVLYNTANVFDATIGEYDANPILIEVNGEVEKLLGESDITTIAIDGGNRKWIGTSSSGVFCLSEDGTEEIYRYTKENSPLISNNIFDIRMDYLSGEVYIATESGLVSVRTDASLGDPEFDNVTVFPNPVRPDYLGPITIQGLGYESDVKITDISGNVVYKTFSNGGTVIWDGNTVQGNRAKSGVYLVWSAVSNGKGRKVAKILLIN